MKFFKKPFVFSAVYSSFIIALSLILILETFVIPQDYSDGAELYTAGENILLTKAPETDMQTTEKGDAITAAQSTDAYTDGPSDTAPGNETENDTVPETEGPKEPVITDNTYKDENIQITVDEVRYADTTVFVADIQINSLAYLKTALAQDTFGKNYKEYTSELASRKNALIAINGDYYGAHNNGYVIKNGVLYRSKIRSETQYDDLVIYNNGTFGFVNEKDISAKELVDNGAYQLFMFGPTLVKRGRIVVDEDAEVAVSMKSNPRCAIGMIDELHYVFIVSNGRLKNEKGLSLYELGKYMHDLGCESAYNLDGGGSATMWFNGKILNTPVTNGADGEERRVSDIVYIGY